jgi:hypothetical protein
MVIIESIGMVNEEDSDDSTLSCLFFILHEFNDNDDIYNYYLQLFIDTKSKFN